MKKIFRIIVLSAVSVLMLTSCGGSTQVDNSQVESELNAIQEEKSKIEADYSQLMAEYNSLKSEYDEYKEKMKPYEELSEKEAEARKIEADKAIEAQKKEEEEAAAKEAEEKAEKEKQGYETGITYDQLARTPDEYEDEKVKFEGTVAQVLENDGQTQIRLAVNDDYDCMILGVYDSSIVNSRVLEDDYITVYGVSRGLISYESTLGGTITIPAVWIDKIDQ